MVRSPKRQDFINALRFSSVVLFKVGYRDTQVASREGAKIKIEYLVVLQWAIGYYILAALVITVANTQPLINRLLSGIF